MGISTKNRSESWNNIPDRPSRCLRKELRVESACRPGLQREWGPGIPTISPYMLFLERGFAGYETGEIASRVYLPTLLGWVAYMALDRGFCPEELCLGEGWDHL